jgi:hypothetical protein
MRNRRCLSTAALLGALVAHPGCSDATGPLPDEGAPDELTFSIGGFAVDSRELELRGDTVVLVRRSWRWIAGDAVDSVRAVPTSDQWRAFWMVAERAGLARWREQYLAEDIVDGTGWSLRLAVGGYVITSSGSNAYPDWRGREHEGLMTDEFRAFLTALGALVGEPV